MSSPQNLSCVAVVNLMGAQRQSQGQSSNASCFTRTEVDQSLLLFLCFCFIISCCSCLFLALLPISEGYLSSYLFICYLSSVYLLDSVVLKAFSTLNSSVIL